MCQWCSRCAVLVQPVFATNGILFIVALRVNHDHDVFEIHPKWGRGPRCCLCIPSRVQIQIHMGGVSLLRGSFCQVVNGSGEAYRHKGLKF